MPTLSMTVTDAGRAALVNAQHTGTLPVTIAQCGVSGSVVAPAPTATTLPGEVKRITTIAGDVVAADTIHIVVKDESGDAFTCRSLALYLGDGTLFAIYGQAAPIIEKTAQSIMLLAIDIKFADINATDISFGDISFINPPATETVKGVAKLATQALTDAGVDDTTIVTPKKLWTRLSSYLASWGADIWRASNDGAGSGLDADMLDGQHGSYYADIPARQGYVSANRAGDTFTGDVTVQRNVAGPTIIKAANAASGAAAVARYDLSTGTAASYAIIALTDNNGAPYLNLSSGPAVRYFVYDAEEHHFRRRDGSNMLSVLASAFTYLGNIIWHSGNDGAGSGLDADQLDGQHGSYYADIPARQGYVSANRAGDTFTGDVTVQRNLAGPTIIKAANSASGPAAVARYDLSTGTASSYAIIALTDNNSAPYLNISSGPAVRYFVYDAEEHHFRRRNGTTMMSILPSAITYLGNVVWHAGNDGAGSGLDADMLDGNHAAAFAFLSQFVSNFTVNGYQILPGGLIIQWGGGTQTYSTGEQAITFPIAFPNAPLRAVTSNAAGGPPVAFHGTSEPTTTGMIVYSAKQTLVAANAGAAFNWIAVGY